MKSAKELGLQGQRGGEAAQSRKIGARRVIDQANLRTDSSISLPVRGVSREGPGSNSKVRGLRASGRKRHNMRDRS